MTLLRKTPLLLVLALSAPLAFAAKVDKVTPADPAATAETGATASAGQKSWADLDADKNGSLTQAEAGVVPALADVFAKADANADGALTGDEYRAYVDANAKAGAQKGTTSGSK